MYLPTVVLFERSWFPEVVPETFNSGVITRIGSMEEGLVFSSAMRNIMLQPLSSDEGHDRRMDEKMDYFIYSADKKIKLPDVDDHCDILITFFSLVEWIIKL